MADGSACPEHVWVLQDLVTGADGRLTQRYGCARCPAQHLVGPDEVPPHSPDWPA